MPDQTFTPIPGRPTEYYTFNDGVFIGWVRCYENGWGFTDRGGRPPCAIRWETRRQAGEALAFRPALRAAERSLRDYAQAAWRRAWRTALVSPGVC